MDLSHLVHTIGRLIRHRAVRYALLGAAIFLVDASWRGAPPEEAPPPERAQIVITQDQIRVARERFAESAGHPPSREQERELIQTMVDREVLVQYALLLGMDEQPAAKHRLVQVARFVAENPETHSDEEMYQEAVDLGLNRDDLVLRRQLTDAAERLIRAAIWRVEPSEVELEEFYRANAQHFQRPARVRISHAFFSRDVRGNGARTDARRLVDALEERPWNARVAAKYGDPAFIDRSLPLMSAQELGRSFGQEFAATVMEFADRTWAGPVRSPYGWHVVFIHERQEAYLPPLPELRSKVLVRWRHDVADQWFSERLAQLRGEFEIRIEGASG